MKGIGLYILTIFLLSSCLDIDEASEIPEIKLKEFKYEIGLDSLDNLAYLMEMTLTFIDGDGDIGSVDTINQLFVTPLRKKFKVVADTLDTMQFKIPYIEPVKTIRVMNGEIKCEFLVTTLEQYQINDTIVYEAFIVDRARHKSNVVRTTTDFIIKFPEN